MKIAKKDLDDTLKIVKRVLKKDKKEGKMLVLSKGDGILHFHAKNARLEFVTTVETDETDAYAFFVNPHDFGKVISGKARDMQFVRVDGKISEEGSRTTYPIVEVEVEKAGELVERPVPKMKPFANPKEFIQLLKEADDVLYVGEQDCSSYLKLSSKQGLAVEPKRINAYRLDEEFDFRTAFLHKEDVSVLAVSLSKDIRHGFEEERMIIQDGRFSYYVRIQASVAFPNLRNIRANESTGKTKFIVDADQMNKQVKTYTKKCESLKVTTTDTHLVLDPRDENFQVTECPFTLKEGVWKPSLFDASAFKGLFMGYQGEVEVEHLEFQNVFGTIGYMWRITSPEKMTMIGGISEPVFDDIEKQVLEKRKIK